MASNLQRLQTDVYGNVIDTTIEIELVKPENSGAPARVVDVNRLNRILAKASQEISDPLKFEKISELHETNAAAFNDLDAIISNLEYAGKDVPKSMIEQRASLRLDLEISQSQLQTHKDG